MNKKDERKYSGETIYIYLRYKYKTNNINIIMTIPFYTW